MREFQLWLLVKNYREHAIQEFSFNYGGEKKHTPQIQTDTTLLVIYQAKSDSTMFLIEIWSKLV
jgi:hypothetical protein